MSGQTSSFAVGATIDVRVVNVEVVATGQDGRPVAGLARESFRLFVDGRETPIEYFSEVAQGAVAATAASGDHASQPAAPAPRHFLIFVDDALAIPKFRDAILLEIEDHLADLGPGDELAVLAFDGDRVRVLCGWSADRTEIARALREARQLKSLGLLRLAQQRVLERDNSFRMDLDGPRPASGVVGMRETVAQEGDPFGGYDPGRGGGRGLTSGPAIPFGGQTPEVGAQLRRTAPALASALRAFATPSGRRILVLVSGAWAIDAGGGALNEVVDAALQHGYTVYPLDASAHTVEQLVSADHWASVTGGRALVGDTKHGAFAKLADDSASYYSLGFTPAWKERDREHSVHVESTRAGVTLRGRVAFRETSGRTEAHQSAQEVLLLGGRPEDKRLKVELGSPERSRHGNVDVHAVIRVPVSELAFQRLDARFAAEAYVSAAVEDDKGSRALAPGFHGRVWVDSLEQDDGYAAIRLRLTLRRTGQKLVFVVGGAARGPYLWGEARLDPRSK